MFPNYLPSGCLCCGRANQNLRPRRCFTEQIAHLIAVQYAMQRVVAYIFPNRQSSSSYLCGRNQAKLATSISRVGTTSFGPVWKPALRGLEAFMFSDLTFLLFESRLHCLNQLQRRYIPNTRRSSLFLRCSRASMGPLISSTPVCNMSTMLTYKSSALARTALARRTV